jgi:hypothetical protein
MNEVQLTVHGIEDNATCALTEKAGECVVVTFGDYKQTPLSLKGLLQLIKLRFPKKKPAPAPAPAAANGPPVPAVPK